MANQGTTYLLQDFKGLGTSWYIELFESVDEARLKKCRQIVTDRIADFEHRYSRFKQDSVLSLLNTKQLVGFDDHLKNMLVFSEELYTKTNGLFDVFIKQDLEAIGYGQRLQETSHSAASSLSQERIIFGKDYIKKLSPKEIDLGGIGKGYLIDVLAEVLVQECGFKYFLINGGGDMYGTSNHGKPVELLLEHPSEPKKYIGKVSIVNQSLCASSSYKRAWVKDGITRNHFIDTKNNQVLEGASFVISNSATIADTLATICIISKDDAELLSEIVEHYDSEALVITEGEIAFITPAFDIALRAI